MQICMLAPSPRHVRFMPCYLVRPWSCTVEIIACDVLCSGVKASAVLAFIYTCGFVRMGVYLSRTMMFLQCKALQNVSSMLFSSRQGMIGYSK